MMNTWWSAVLLCHLSKALVKSQNIVSISLNIQSYRGRFKSSVSHALLSSTHFCISFWSFSLNWISHTHTHQYFCKDAVITGLQDHHSFISLDLTESVTRGHIFTCSNTDTSASHLLCCWRFPTVWCVDDPSASQHTSHIYIYTIVTPEIWAHSADRHVKSP